MKNQSCEMTQKNFRYVVLTGPPGCGKTTLIKKVIDVLKTQNITLNGFFTEELRVGRKRIGFDVVLLNGERTPLARIQSGTHEKPMVGKYAVELKSFELCILPVLNLQEESSILVLDEIGKMELLSTKFKESVVRCFNNEKNIILATVPVKTGKPIPALEMIKTHPDTCLIPVAEDNRDLLVHKITRLIINAKERNSITLG